MNEDRRKGLEFSKQREKHCSPFGYPVGQSSQVCKVICARLRNKARRVRHDLNVLLRIYILFHLPEYIMEKKNDSRLFPFSEICHSNKLCVRTLPICDLPRIMLTAVSAALLPLLRGRYLCPVFACLLALFRFAAAHVYLVRYHYHHQSFRIHRDYLLIPDPHLLQIICKVACFSGVKGTTN